MPKVQATWSQAGVFELPSGNLNLMLQNLTIPFTYQEQHRVLQVCGTAYAPTHPVVLRCLGRMRVWRELALSSLDTEFPSYEVCQSFSVLVLGNQRQQDIMGSSPVKADHLHRLALLADVDPSELLKQHHAYYPGAAMYYNAARGEGASSGNIRNVGRRMPPCSL